MKCVRCGAWSGNEAWRTLCKSCYILSRREEEEEVRQQLAYYRAECDRLRRTVPTTGIPQDKLRSLVQLCHPDKHNGSKTANKITAWLLTLREKK